MDKIQKPSVSTIISELRCRLKEEIEAANWYAGTLSWFKDAGITGEIMERLTEIYSDEIMHAGSLLYMIGDLDNSISELLEEGARGK